MDVIGPFFGLTLTVIVALGLMWLIKKTFILIKSLFTGDVFLNKGATDIEKIQS